MFAEMLTHNFSISAGLALLLSIWPLFWLATWLAPFISKRGGTLVAARAQLALPWLSFWRYRRGSDLEATDENGVHVFTGALELARQLSVAAPKSSKNDFINYTTFLERVDDLGKESGSKLKFLVVLLLTVLECWIGIRNVWANINPDASPNQVFWAAICGSIVVGIALTLTMEIGGRSLRIRRVWREKERVFHAKAAEGAIFAVEERIEAGPPQDDGDSPGWRQFISRADRSSGHAFWFAILLIVGLTALLTVVRLTHAEAASREERREQETSFSTEADRELGAIELTSKQRADADDLAALLKIETTASFITLGVFFALTQGYGIFVGYRDAHFSPKDQFEKAIKHTEGFTTWDQYQRARKDYLQECNGLLQRWWNINSHSMRVKLEQNHRQARMEELFPDLNGDS